MRLTNKFKKRMMIFSVIFIGVIGIIGIALLIFLNQPQFGDPPIGKKRKDFLQSKQYNGTTFQNRYGVKVNMNFFKAMKLMPQWLNGKGDKFPTHPIPVIKRNTSEFMNTPDTLLRLTWFGHSAFLIDIDGKRLMLDPMLGISPSPVSFFSRRFFDTLPLEVKDIPPLDAIIFSHDHFDHLDYKTVLQLKDRVGHFYVPLGVGSHLKKWGVEENKITELDWWDEVEFNGLHFVCTPSQHFSGRSLTDRNKTLWCSWVIKGKSKQLYFSGDSGYSEWFKEIGNKFGPFDICLMECGQYNVLWKEIHMMPEETVHAQIDLQGKLLLPIHWGAFSLSLHKWSEPVERLLMYAKMNNISVTTPMIGESINLGEKYPNEKWWVGK